jgi:succinate--hydroxymethylglutarate CoA-transferase
MPYGPINSIKDSLKHPQAPSRGMIDAVYFEASVNEELRVVGVPVKFGDTKPSIRRRLPLLGEHTEEILIEAGIAREKIEWLKKCFAM